MRGILGQEPGSRTPAGQDGASAPGAGSTRPFPGSLRSATSCRISHTQCLQPQRRRLQRLNCTPSFLGTPTGAGAGRTGHQVGRAAFSRGCKWQADPQGWRSGADRVGWERPSGEYAPTALFPSQAGCVRKGLGRVLRDQKTGFPKVLLCLLG